jgi:hypothetical protein
VLAACAAKAGLAVVGGLRKWDARQAVAERAWGRTASDYEKGAQARRLRSAHAGSVPALLAEQVLADPSA